MSFYDFKDKESIDIYEDDHLTINGPKSEYTHEVMYVDNKANYKILYTVQSIYDKVGNRITIYLKDQVEPSSYILKSLTRFLCQPDHLLYKNNRLRTDYISEVLNSAYIEIHNAVIDQKLIMLLNRYFPKLREIAMYKCTIKPNCSFNSFKDYVGFDGCTIESLTCLNDLDSQILEINTCHFQKMPPVTINTQVLKISCYNKKEINQYYENIFLSCYFPKLMYLSIENDDVKAEILDSALLFLPHSVPNICQLYIRTGEINNINYLYNLPNLSYSVINYLVWDNPYEVYDGDKYMFPSYIRAEIKRKFLNYSTDDLDIYLNKKYPKMIYKPNEKFDCEYYFVYDDVKKNIKKIILEKADHLYTTKWGSWIEEDQVHWAVRRNISPVICAKPSIIHPTGKVLFFSDNPHNYYNNL